MKNKKYKWERLAGQETENANAIPPTPTSNYDAPDINGSE